MGANKTAAAAAAISSKTTSKRGAQQTRGTDDTKTLAKPVQRVQFIITLLQASTHTPHMGKFIQKTVLWSRGHHNMFCRVHSATIQPYVAYKLHLNARTTRRYQALVFCIRTHSLHTHMQHCLLHHWCLTAHAAAALHCLLELAR